MQKKNNLAKRHPLEKLARRTLKAHGMIRRGEHVLAGVSGGPDSIALLQFLRAIAPELDLTITVAHLNHRIRGAEADEDELFVRQISREADISFISERIEILSMAAEAKRNLEELAREQRYAFLRRVAEEVDAQKIAVGHNLNDQAETVLFRFLRGSGIEGLSAIHPVVEDTVIRPLIECPRELILDYLSQTQCRFREDSTNLEPHYSRNRIRRDLIPYLETNFNRQLIPTLAREASLAREAWSFIEMEARRHFDRMHVERNREIELCTADLAVLHPALQKQILREALNRLAGSLRGIASAHLDSLLSLCRREGGRAMAQLPHGIVAEREFGSLVLHAGAIPVQPGFSYELDIPGICRIAETGATLASRISVAPDPEAMKNTCSRQAFFETSSLPGRLRIRSREPGDRYGGKAHRKVKKMLIDHKIPFGERQSLPMIVANGDVIWIPGFRPAPSYALRPGSTACVEIEYRKPESSS